MYIWKYLFSYSQCSELDILAANIDEIKKQKENHVFEPIYYNSSKTIPTKWVLTESLLMEREKSKLDK